jgi:hypothetical protein
MAIAVAESAERRSWVASSRSLGSGVSTLALVLGGRGDARRHPDQARLERDRAGALAVLPVALGIPEAPAASEAGLFDLVALSHLERTDRPKIEDRRHRQHEVFAIGGGELLRVGVDSIQPARENLGPAVLVHLADVAGDETTRICDLVGLIATAERLRGRFGAVEDELPIDGAEIEEVLQVVAEFVEDLLGTGIGHEVYLVP